MAVVMVRLEKRAIRVETLAKASELERILPPPPPLAQYPHIPQVQSAEWSFEIPTPRMLVEVSLPR